MGLTRLDPPRFGMPSMGLIMSMGLAQLDIQHPKDMWYLPIEIESRTKHLNGL